MKYTDLNLKPEIVKALKENGIVEATEIQEKTIPLIIENKDVIGMSKTGSGKTAAFVVPLLQLLEKTSIQTLILSPTRELAVQIANEIEKFGKYVHPKVATIYGGVGYGPQIKAIKTANMVVATPGRLLDLLERGDVSFPKLKHFVLDEADKMVEMGFIEDIERIMKATPEQKQISLFGATLSSEIDYLKAKHMTNPITIEAEAYVGDSILKQYYYDVKQHQKFSLLVHLLKTEDVDRVIIFCSTINTVKILTDNLRRQGIKAEMMHGKLSQTRRLSVIENFHKDKIKILVASSVAARGLDIKGVTHVFNYDLSKDSQEYIHRIGRTARAGDEGKAITLLSDKDYDTFNQILNRYGNVKVEELKAEGFEKLPFHREEMRSRDRKPFDKKRNSRGTTHSNPSRRPAWAR